MRPEAEWKAGPDFAEYAEALRINTSQILAVVVNEGTTYVMFTETDDPDAVDLLAAGFERDADGILRQTKRTRREVNAMARIHEEIGKRLEQELGPPPGREEA